MSLRLAILADDLTGALDSAAPFAGRGFRVEVALRPDATADAVAVGADVVAVSTCSRELEPDQARAAVAKAMAALPPGTRLFKKIDSRLKGHIATELSALRFSRALVAPAIVDFGRNVKGGAVTGFGVADPIPVAPVLAEFVERSIIPDVENDTDMRAALDSAADVDLLIGARGLAEALARKMTGREDAAASPLAGPCGILLVGSRDPITLAQVAALRGQEGVLHLAAPNGVFDPGVAVASAANLLLIQAVPGQVAIRSRDVAANLARYLHPVLTARCNTLLLTGGATAEAVLGTMNIDRMRLLGECLPGLPVAVADGLSIVTKSGGFGDVGTLVCMSKMIHGVSP